MSSRAMSRLTRAVITNAREWRRWNSAIETARRHYAALVYYTDRKDQR